MNWLIDQLAKEWAVIKEAPISFFLVCALSVLLAFFIVRWIIRKD
jgi:uncharacterized membrane protein